MKTTAKTTTKKSTSASRAKTANTSKATASKTTAVRSAVQGKVKAKPTAAEGLKELYIDCLKDIYWAEKALLKTLPKMAKNAESKNLTSAIDGHMAETEEQVSRLEKVFELIGKKATGKKCEAMDGLLKEGQDILESTEPGPVRDAGIIAASQKIEHYEIATYGTLCAFAKTLGQEKALELLHTTLEEEKNADITLTEAAYNTINFDAADEDADMME